MLVRLFVALVGITTAEEVAGRLIVQLAAARMKRDAPGDIHEVRHLYAAITAGDSSDCESAMCRLDTEALERWKTRQHADVAAALGLPR